MKANNQMYITCETAEMPLYTEKYFDLAGFTIGVIDNDKS